MNTERLDFMKIIHTSDLHLDSPLTSKLSRLKAKERRGELISGFRAIADTAEKENVRAVIIAGDLFDNDSVSQKTLNYIMSVIGKCRSVEFLYLSGNHEKKRLLESGVERPENLKIFGDAWTYFDIDGITFAGRSTICENMFDSLTLKEDSVNIVVLHGILAEHTDTTDKIGEKDFSHLPIDYLALGHYHTYSKKKIGERCVAVYSGTPEGRGFDEAGDKGYSLISIDGNIPEHRFIRSMQRKIHIKEFFFDGSFDDIILEDKISELLSDVQRDDIVRLVLKGTYKPGEKPSTERISKRFESLYYYFEIKDETALLISPLEYKNDKSLKGEFIRTVMAKTELSDSEKAEIIECGIKALAGEEL